MDRPSDREDFKAFVTWWYKGAIPLDLPDDVKEALESNQPEALNKASLIWNVWWQHRFGQNPNSRIYQSSRDQTHTGPRGGLYKTTKTGGRRYI